MRPPLWMDPAGMPVKIGVGADSAVPSKLIRTTRLSCAVVM